PASGSLVLQRENRGIRIPCNRAANFLKTFTRELYANNISLTSLLACWTTQGRKADRGKGILCRNLCRNLLVPTRVRWCWKVSVERTVKEVRTVKASST